MRGQPGVAMATRTAPGLEPMKGGDNGREVSPLTWHFLPTQAWAWVQENNPVLVKC